MLEHNETEGLEDDGLELLYSHRKRKKQSLADADEFHDLDPSDVRQMKRIELALITPSYLLGRGSKQLRPENREKLWLLLRRLVKQHNWVEASGVLSVLLKATCKDRSPENNRLKYPVLMEVLSRVEGEQFNFSRIKHIYDIWMRRTGSRRKCSIQDKLAVHLEFILFCLNQGNVSEAHQASISITQENELESDPMANMVVGLVFYQLWYSSIPKEMQRIDVEQLHTPSELDMMDEGFGSLAENTEKHTALYSCEANSHFQYDSDSSVMIDKRLSGYALSEKQREGMENVEDLNKEPLLQNAQSHGFYINSTENESSLPNDAKHVRCASILPNLGALDPCLFPIQLPPCVEDIEDLIQLHKVILNDYYKDALKYLQLALDSLPPGSDALLPLIQLLLIGGKVNEAFNVLDNVCQKSETAFPSRTRSVLDDFLISDNTECLNQLVNSHLMAIQLFGLRAILLEHLDHRNYTLLSSCYEHVLKKDPTCCHSISRLVNMHQLGEYSVESLVEMIALHLDAANAAPSTWQEFAMCFFKLAKQEEDRLSVCLNGGESGPRQRYSGQITVIPKIFTAGNSGKAWSFRCRWWLRRYFSCSILESDIAAGDLQLLTNKAASAAHMYGQQSEYVARISHVLDQRENRDMFLFLQLHKENALGLHMYFQQTHNAR